MPSWKIPERNWHLNNKISYKWVCLEMADYAVKYGKGYIEKRIEKRIEKGKEKG